MSLALPESLSQDTAQLGGVANQLASILAATTELFGHIDDARVVDDPEISNLRYLTISVTAMGTVSKVLDLKKEWNGRIRNMLREDSNRVQLAIDIVE